MSNVNWENVPTRRIDVGGVPFAYRELGPNSGVPVIFLHHLMAVLDDWDPRVIDGIAAQRRVIAFDNRGVGASGGSVPPTIEEMGGIATARGEATVGDRVFFRNGVIESTEAPVLTIEIIEV